MIKVNIYRAVLTVEGERVKLTRSIAQQFPLDEPRRKRYMNAISNRPLRDPIGKVRGYLLGVEEFPWLYLVPEPESGLAWAFPICPIKALADDMQAKGQHVDDPSQVPTLIL